MISIINYWVKYIYISLLLIFLFDRSLFCKNTFIIILYIISCFYSLYMLLLLYQNFSSKISKRDSPRDPLMSYVYYIYQYIYLLVLQKIPWTIIKHGIHRFYMHLESISRNHLCCHIACNWVAHPWYLSGHLKIN